MLLVLLLVMRMMRGVDPSVITTILQAAHPSLSM